MNNFYNSPALTQRLKSLNIDCVGTLRLNRKDVAKMVWDKKLKKGEMIAQHSGSGVRFEVAWQKICGNDFNISWGGNRKKLTKRGQGREKPVSVLDYNENMGGVDLKDQVLQPYVTERKKMTKWYMKMFRLLNVTILNWYYTVQIQVSPKLTILNSEKIWYRLYLLNMGEKLKGKWKAIIPLTKMCHDFLKDISPKESHQQARRPGQRSGV